MALDYARFAASARRAIANAGRLVTVERLSTAPSDAARPWNGPAAPTLAASKTAPAVFVPVSGAGLGKEVMDAELFKNCKQVCLVAPAEDGFAFDTCHRLKDSDGSYQKIDAVQVLRPGSTVVLYMLGVSL